MFPRQRRFIDIGANLTDPMFRGVYHSTKKHQSDIKEVLSRAWNNGLEKIFISGSSLMDCEEAFRISKREERLYCTIGCHPTACMEIERSGDPEKYLADLRDLALKYRHKAVAVECGLDYTRLHFCPKETQRRFFEMQLDLVEDLRLPVIIHCRGAASDVMEILDRNRDKLHRGGAVRSFDGTEEEAAAFIDRGFYIGISSCSLKTQENLRVVGTIPLERLVTESDAPYCDIHSRHAGYKYIKTQFDSYRKDKWKYGKMVKGRWEPSHILQVFDILASAREEPSEALCPILYENAENCFFRRFN